MLPAESLMCSRRLMSVLHYYYYEMYLCNLNTDLAFMFHIKHAATFTNDMHFH